MKSRALGMLLTTAVFAQLQGCGAAASSSPLLNANRVIVGLFVPYEAPAKTAKPVGAARMGIPPDSSTSAEICVHHPQDARPVCMNEPIDVDVTLEVLWYADGRFVIGVFAPRGVDQLEEAQLGDLAMAIRPRVTSVSPEAIPLSASEYFGIAGND